MMIDKSLLSTLLSTDNTEALITVLFTSHDSPLHDSQFLTSDFGFRGTRYIGRVFRRYQRCERYQQNLRVLHLIPYPANVNQL